MVRPYVYKCHIGLCTPRRTLMDSKKKKKKSNLKPRVALRTCNSERLTRGHVEE